MVKFSTAAAGVPTLLTLALVPAAPVVVVPTLTVAADPVGPVGPGGPTEPICPAGIPKFRTAAEGVPALTTVALAPGVRVVVLPTVTLAAGPPGPVAPVAPAGPVGPVVPGLPCTPWAPGDPWGMVKLRIASWVVPELLTAAAVPGGTVVVVPTLVVAGVPGGPGKPVAPWEPCGPIGPVGPGIGAGTAVQAAFLRPYKVLSVAASGIPPPGPPPTTILQAAFLRAYWLPSAGASGMIGGTLFQVPFCRPYITPSLGASGTPWAWVLVGTAVQLWFCRP